MASKSSKLGIVSVAALIVLGAVVAFTPRNNSSRQYAPINNPTIPNHSSNPQDPGQPVDKNASNTEALKDAEDNVATALR